MRNAGPPATGKYQANRQGAGPAAIPPSNAADVIQNTGSKTTHVFNTRLILALIPLTAISAVGWFFLIKMEAAMRVMNGEGVFMALMWMMMDPGEPLSYLSATTFMWIMMMIAMMVPVVMPMLFVFRRLERGANSEFDTFLFAGGYLLAWCTFSFLAATLQWLLHSAGRLHGDLLSIQTPLAAAVLIAAGMYQLTPMKKACLDKCRSPMGFYLTYWRKGRWGAVSMGLQHGFFCIGCCWMLMLIMFVGGAMSVLMMAALAVFILAERILPAGPWVAHLPGVVLMIWGGYLAVLTILAN